MNSWSSFVRSTLKDLHSGSEVPDYFGNLIPLVSRNAQNNFPPKNANPIDYKEEDDLISIDAVQVQNPRYNQQQNRQQQSNNYFFANNMNNRSNNFNNNRNYNLANKFDNQQPNDNYSDLYQNPNEIYDDRSPIPQPENSQRFNNRNSNINNNNYHDIQDNYRQNQQQKQMPYYEEDNNQDYQNNIIPPKRGQNTKNSKEITDDLVNPDFIPLQQEHQQQLSESPVRQDPQPQRQKQQQVQNQHNISDSFEESPKRNLNQQQSSHDTQSTPEGSKQSKEKVFVPETPEMVDYPSSASDVPWQDVPKSSPQPFPSESLINAIDQIGVYEDKQQQQSQNQNQQSSKQKKQQQFNEQNKNQQQQQQDEQDQESFVEYSFDHQQQEKQQQQHDEEQNSFNEYSFDKQKQQNQQQQQQQDSFNEYSFDQQQQEKQQNIPQKQTQKKNQQQQQQNEDSFNDYSFDHQMQRSQPQKKTQQQPPKQQQQHSFNDYQEEENEIEQEQADDDDNNISINDEINIDEKIPTEEEETSDIAPVPFSERFRILSGGIIDRYWSHVDTEVPRIVPQSKILTSFKASKFIKYKNAMDSFAKKVEEKKHHLRFKTVDQS